MKSKRLPKNPPTAKASFIKMAIAGVALITLILICVREIDPGLRATLLTFVAIVVFPSTLLFGVDAGKAIKRSEVPGAPSNKFAAVLIFPQAISEGFLSAPALSCHSSASGHLRSRPVADDLPQCQLFNLSFL